jgi:hypothetical protein
MRNNLKKLVKLSPVLLGIGFLVWGLVINAKELDEQRDAFTDLYYLIPLLGGAVQYLSSNSWGGMKSYIGRSFRFFSIALFAEGAGLLVYSWYFRIKGEELAYPSVGDFIFVLGIICFVLGSYWMLRVIAPTKKQLFRPVWHSALTVALLAGVLYFVWNGFLNIGIADDRGAMTDLFNILYPTTQLLYLGLCLLALLKVRTTSGGKMFRPVLYLLLSMCMLYVSDYVFLKQSYEETWQAAGSSDMLYIAAYTMIIGSLLYFDQVRGKILRGKK